jgi:hypothetical protein
MFVLRQGSPRPQSGFSRMSGFDRFTSVLPLWYL